MKHLFALFAALFLAASSALAADDAVRHFATRSGLHFYAGSNVVVKDTAETVFAAGGDINVSDVDVGEVIAAGGTVVVDDIVTSRIIAAGGNVLVGGTVTRSVIAAGGDVDVKNGTQIGGDAILAGGNIAIDGAVTGDLVAAGGTITVGGTVGGDAQLRGKKIIFRPGAVVTGKLTYSSDDALEMPQNVTIGGGINRDEQNARRSFAFGDLGVGAFMASLVAALLFGLVALSIFAAIVLALFGGQIDRASAALSDEPLQSLGVGILLTMVFPVTIVILLITIIGIPFSLFLMFAGWLLAGFGAVVAAYWIGDKVRDVVADGRSPPAYFPALGWTFLGLVLFCAAGILPGVGTLAQFFALVTGCGAFVLSMMRGRGTPRGQSGGVYAP